MSAPNSASHGQWQHDGAALTGGRGHNYILSLPPNPDGIITPTVSCHVAARHADSCAYVLVGTRGGGGPCGMPAVACSERLRPAAPVHSRAASGAHHHC